jgi:hypothetical protein
MHSIFDVLKRLAGARPFTEAEQAVAHELIDDAQAAFETHVDELFSAIEKRYGLTPVAPAPAEPRPAESDQEATVSEQSTLDPAPSAAG